MLKRRNIIRLINLFILIIAINLLIGCATESDVTLKFIHETNENPFVNDHVKITNSEGNRAYVSRTNSSGEVKFEDVPHGKYKMTFICHPNEGNLGGSGYAQTREVKVSGLTTNRTFKVKPIQGNTHRSVIIYTLFNSNDQNMNDADVRLTHTTTQSVRNLKTTNGSAVFEEIPVGNYTLRISHPAITTFESNLNVNMNLLREYKL